MSYKDWKIGDLISFKDSFGDDERMFVMLLSNTPNGYNCLILNHYQPMFIGTIGFFRYVPEELGTFTLFESL